MLLCFCIKIEKKKGTKKKEKQKRRKTEVVKNNAVHCDLDTTE